MWSPSSTRWTPNEKPLFHILLSFRARSFVLVGKNSSSSYGSSNNINNLVYFWDVGYMYAVDGSEVYLTAVVYSRKRVNSANILSRQVYLLDLQQLQSIIALLMFAV